MDFGSNGEKVFFGSN